MVVWAHLRGDLWGDPLRSLLTLAHDAIHLQIWIFRETKRKGPQLCHHSWLLCGLEWEEVTMRHCRERWMNSWWLDGGILSDIDMYYFGKGDVGGLFGEEDSWSGRFVVRFLWMEILCRMKTVIRLNALERGNASCKLFSLEKCAWIEPVLFSGLKGKYFFKY